MNEEVESLIDHFSRLGISGTDASIELYPKNKETSTIEELLKQQVKGLLSQPTLTKDQADLLGMFLDVWLKKEHMK